MKRSHALGSTLVFSLSILGGCGHSSDGDPAAAVAPELRAEAARAQPSKHPTQPRAEAKVVAPQAAAAAENKAAAPPHEADPERCHAGDNDEDDARVEQVSVGSSPSRGPEAAPVTVVVFSDYQCPFCRKSESTIHELEAAYPGKVRYVWKNNPLPFHEHAHLAAKAALAAGEQGKFWEYHDALFMHQDALDRASLERYADELGLDTRRFHAALEDVRLEAAIDADTAEAVRLDVRGTPAFFVNGRRVVGAQPLAKFKDKVDEALASR